MAPYAIRNRAGPPTWRALAIHPHHRADWALENALVVLVVLALALTQRRLALSRLSYTLVFVFLSLHVVGAPYTCSEVPYDAWGTALTGRSLRRSAGAPDETPPVHPSAT